MGGNGVSRTGYPNRLTEREHEILLLIAGGWNNARIAGKLSLSLRTIKFHTGNIYSKLGVTSRSEAIVWVWAHGEAQNPPEN
jgi:DNA-binding NarL/FixJ family response regulator